MGRKSLCFGEQTKIFSWQHRLMYADWMTSNSTAISHWRVYFSIGNFCESLLSGRSIGLTLSGEMCISPVNSFALARSWLSAVTSGETVRLMAELS